MSLSFILIIIIINYYDYSLNYFIYTYLTILIIDYTNFNNTQPVKSTFHYLLLLFSFNFIIIDIFFIIFNTFFIIFNIFFIIFNINYLFFVFIIIAFLLEFINNLFLLNSSSITEVMIYVSKN